LELTKKRRIEKRFIGHPDKLRELSDFAKTLGLKEVSDSVDWKDVFPDATPGLSLRGARKKEGLTQRRLAELSRIPQGHISFMEKGKMGIGKERAKRFAEILNVDYRVFL